jgi:very-short-patch-repair endonuclease
LEGLGWKIHRVWSTDWFQNPGREIERLEEALKAAQPVRAV